MVVLSSVGPNRLAHHDRLAARRVLEGGHRRLALPDRLQRLQIDEIGRRGDAVVEHEELSVDLEMPPLAAAFAASGQRGDRQCGRDPCRAVSLTHARLSLVVVPAPVVAPRLDAVAAHRHVAPEPATVPTAVEEQPAAVRANPDPRQHRAFEQRQRRARQGRFEADRRAAAARPGHRLAAIEPGCAGAQERRHQRRVQLPSARRRTEQPVGRLPDGEDRCTGRSGIGHGKARTGELVASESGWLPRRSGRSRPGRRSDRRSAAGRRAGPPCWRYRAPACRPKSGGGSRQRPCAETLTAKLRLTS